MKRPLQQLLPLVGALLAVLPSATARAQVTPDELEVVLAIDTSGSMRHVIEAAKAAATEFVVAMPPDVRIGVETFGDDVTVLSSPTLDRAVLADQIGRIVTDGDTALYDAVVTAGSQFSPAAERRVLVLLSDGRDDGSTATLEQAIAAVQDEHVEAISLTTPETDLTSLAALGTVTSADDLAGVSAAFARVVALLTEVVAPSTVPATVAPPTTPAPTAAPTTAPAPAVPVTTTPATDPPATAAATTVASRAPAPSSPRTGSSGAAGSTALWVGAGGIFGGLFALGLVLFPRRRVSKARLGIQQPRRVSDMGQRTTSAVDEALERHGKRTELATALSLADIAVQPGDFIARVGIVALVVGLVALFLGGPLVAVAAAAVVGLAVWWHIRRTTAKRRAAFADQLPDVLQLVTTALRSGYGITQALESVAEEAEEPARGEFGHVLVESRLGRDLSDALRALAVRMESKDLDWVVSAIDINRETGGNLSEILGTVSATIRERQRMARHVRTLTAEGRLSARILTGLPFLMAFWQWRTNPEAFALLTHGIGLTALIIAGVLMVLGTVWVRRIVNSIAL
jgi:tight adherence protein B